MANAYSLDFSPIAQAGQEAVQAGNQFQQAAVTQENLKKIKMENAETQRKEEYMNKNIDLTQFLKSSGIPDESIEHATKTAETLGMGQKTDSGYNITMREGQALMQHYETNTDKYKAFTAPMIQEAGVKANTAFREYNETKEKADTDTLKAKALGIKPNEKLQEQLKIAEASYKKEYNNYQELNNKTQQGSDKVAINQEHYQLEQSGEWDKLPANIKIAAMNAAETGDYKTWGAVLTKYKDNKANQTPHVQELTSPDGKTAQKFQFNQETGKFDIPIGDKYKVKSQVTNVNISAGSGGFNKMTPDNKNFWYEQYEMNGKIPPMAYRDTVSRNAFTAGYAQYQRDKGNTGADSAAKQLMTKAQGMALGQAKKIDTAQGIFVNKIDENSKTLDRVKKKYGVDYQKWANVPINKLQEFIGSGDLAAIKLVLKSTSNEVAKIESGSLGIQEVSEGQAQFMKKVHDENLSYNDLTKVVSMGIELGGNARKATKKEIQDLYDEMKGKKSNTESPAGRDTSSAKKFIDASKDKNDAIKRIKSLSAKGWTREEIEESVKGTKWE